jgi:hypothetical protein
MMHHISMVANGKACNCVCPACNAPLVARNSCQNKKVWHFAHYKLTECIYATQTALHLAAKEIFEKSRKFRIPRLGCTLGFHTDDPHYKSGGWGVLYDSSYTFMEAKTIPIKRAYLEKKVDSIIPDIIIETGNKKLLVEIYVTHPIDYAKLQKIRELGISTIEINLSTYEGDLSPESLKKLIISSTEYKTWAYNNHFDELKTHYQEQHNRYVKTLIDKRIEAQKQKLFELEKKRTLYLNNQKLIKFYYKTITGPRDSYERKVEFVESCPIKSTADKSLTAFIKKDCQNCSHFRGFSPTGKTIVCLGISQIS